jgi:predicted nucleotidyltransferase
MTDALERSTLEHTSLSAGAKAIAARLEANADALRTLGVISLTLFGSRVRGDERKDSDLDILIDYDRDRRFTLYDLVEIQRYLSDLVGLDVHIATRDGFTPDHLNRLLKHSLDIF